MRAFMLTVTAAALTLSGCAQMTSSEVATHDIEARITLTANGDGATLIEAELMHDRSTWATFIDLTGGDALQVSTEGRTRTMSSSEAFNVVGYGARIPVDRGGTEFNIDLSRPAFDSAPNSHVQLPPRFRLFTPVRSTYDVDYDTIVLEWDDPSRDTMLLNFEGSCIRDVDYGLTHDEGMFLLRPGMLEAQGHWDGSPCEVRVTAQRVRTGHLDPAFASGTIEAQQVRHTLFWIEGL
jgi:hypothetical protein